MRLTFRSRRSASGSGGRPPLVVSREVANAVKGRERSAVVAMAPLLSDGGVYRRLLWFYRRYRGEDMQALPVFLSSSDKLLRDFGVGTDPMPNDATDEADRGDEGLDGIDAIETRDPNPLHADDEPNQTLDGFELSFVFAGGYLEGAGAKPKDGEEPPPPPAPAPPAVVAERRQAFMSKLESILHDANLEMADKPKFDPRFNQVSVVLSVSNIDMGKLDGLFSSLNVSSPRVYAANGKRIGMQFEL